MVDIIHPSRIVCKVISEETPGSKNIFMTFCLLLILQNGLGCSAIMLVGVRDMLYEHYKCLPCENSLFDCLLESQNQTENDL